MDASVFTDKEKKPGDGDLAAALGATFGLWVTLRNSVLEKYPAALQEWHFPGQKYGWSFRMKDKKRAIIYFLPRDGFFKVALVFGGKATAQALAAEISPAIKSELEQAKAYAEGRGIRIEVRDRAALADIAKLVEIKLAN
jgi:hypothetical protein